MAQLGAHGLVRGSFVPPEPIRQLRDLTRTRTAIIRERSREVQRLEKLLEDAGIKLSAVASAAKVGRRLVWVRGDVEKFLADQGMPTP